MKHISRRAASLTLTAALAAAYIPGSVPVYAADNGISREDTVYIFADAAGDADDITVSSHLILNGATGTVEDSSGLQDITNIKGDETFTQSGDKLLWDAEGEDIYYQGTTDRKAPVSVHVSYLLDGKEITPFALAGKSGDLTISIRYENDSDVSVDANGSVTEINTPFLMMTGVILPAETFENVSVDNGKIVSSGNNSVVLGYGMPGLKESLKLTDIENKLDERLSEDNADNADDPDSPGEETDLDTTEIRQKIRDGLDTLQISDTFEIHADVTDFKLGSTYTFAMSDLFSDLDTGDFFSIDDINEAMEKVRDAGTKLADGSGELLDGTTELKDGYDELDGGIKTLRDGISTLADGSGTLQDGISQYVNGVNSLAGGVTSYVGGVEQVAEGILSLSDLQKGISQLKSGLDTLSSSTGSDSDLVSGINALNDGMQQLKTAADAIDVDKLSQLVKAGKGSLDAADVDLQKVIAAFDGLESAQSQVNGLITQIEQLESGLESLRQAEQGLYDGAKSIAGSEAIRSGVSQSVKGSAPTFSAVTVEEIGSVSISIPEDLPDEQKTALQNAINQANGQISSANDKIRNANQANQTMAATANAAIPGLIDAAVENTAGQISQQIEARLSSVAGQAGSGIDTIQTQLGGLKTKANAISTKLGSVISSPSYQALKTQLPDLKKTLSGLLSSDPVRKLGTLQTSVDQLASGTASLKKAVDKELVPGIQKLDEGAATLHTKSASGISRLQRGVKKLTANDAKLRKGAKQLRSSGKKLNTGAASLGAGVGQLNEGAGRLSSGSDTFKDGVAQLNDGADELHEGLVRLDEKGIQQIADLVEGDLTDFFDRVKAITSPDAVYTSFTGAPRDMDTSVKFVIETASIE